MRNAEQTCVISLSALRNLKFGELDEVYHGILAALGLASFMRAFGNGCWLRSRCQLVPTSPFKWEIVKGANTEAFEEVDAETLLNEVYERVERERLPWHGITDLTPSKELLALVEEGQASLGTGKEKK